MSEENVNVMDVMTGEKYTFPIRGLPFDGPYCTNQRGKDGSMVIALNTQELERLAGEIKEGERLLIYTEK